MAKIIRENQDLENKYHAAKKRAKLFCILSAVSFVICISLFLVNFLMRGRLFFLNVLFTFCLMGCLIATVVSLRSLSSLKSGVEGERTTASLITALPDAFTGFQNLEVSFDGKKSEIDLVVTGPTGVFIIETKNHNGAIVGDYGAIKWRQHKVGRGGTPYSNEFYSPIKQVGTHVYRLANYLRSNRCYVYVNGTVYFSNPSTSVQLLGVPGNIPVFSAQANGAAALLQYIVRRDSSVDPKALQSVNELLRKTGT